MKKLAIIDSYALAHRSYHALPPLTSPDGVLVNGVYGFMLFFLKMLKELNPDYVVATFDLAAPTFRHQEYKEYKAKREKMPDNFYEQILIIKDLLRKFGVPVLEAEGYEADDLIGSVVEKIQDEDLETFIITGDLDTLQLVNDKVFVYTFGRGLQDKIIYNKEKIKERFQLKPEQLIDWKALKGDPSDNIPGVPAIGEKTALMLMKNFNNLDNLYAQLKESSTVEELINKNPELKITPRIFKQLKDFEDQAYFSRHLVLIERKIPLEDFNLEQAKFEIPNEKNLKDLLGKLGFHSLLARVFVNEEVKASKQIKNSLFIVNTPIDLKDLIAKIKAEKTLGLLLDYQGEKWGVRQVKGLGISLSDKLYYLPENSFNDFFKEQIDWQAKKIASFEAKVIFEELKMFPSILIDDIKILAWLIDPDRKNYKISSLEKFFLKQETEESFENSLALLLPLMKAIEEKILVLGLENVWTKIEKPLIPIIALMEENGILLDLDFLKDLDQTNKKEIKKLEEQIYQLAGQEFNINSPQQLSVILFENLGISPKDLKKTSTRKISTKMDELFKIEKEHSIVPLLIKYRGLKKLENSFLETLPKFVNKKTKRIHTIWNQTGTATGRLSSEKPNLQNIPQNESLDKQIRSAFVAEESFSLVSFDYSQIELRLAAHLSQDKKMMEIFNQNKDVHLATASYVHDKPEEEITSEMRNQAKALNFGIIYGMGNRAFAQAANISLKEAEVFRQKYFTQFSSLKKYLDNTLETATRNGYVETIFGRKRLLPLLGTFGRRAKEQERIAFNAPIQGLAADIIKIAMIQIQEYILQHQIEEQARILVQIHDELILEIKSELIKKIAPCFKKIMETAAILTVPLEVKVRKGKDWGKMEELDI